MNGVVECYKCTGDVILVEQKSFGRRLDLNASMRRNRRCSSGVVSRNFRVVAAVLPEVLKHECGCDHCDEHCKNGRYYANLLGVRPRARSGSEGPGGGGGKGSRGIWSALRGDSLSIGDVESMRVDGIQERPGGDGGLRWNIVWPSSRGARARQFRIEKDDNRKIDYTLG